MSASPVTLSEPRISADEARLREIIELLFYAYRDFTGEPDRLLADYGFGRAHHRVIYFVGRHPGATVSHLLGILKITKQSLSRVLNQLLSEGFIVQVADSQDRRRRLLHLTEKGRELEQRLTDMQSRRIARALTAAGSGRAEEFRRILCGLINAEDRRRFPALAAGLEKGGTTD